MAVAVFESFEVSSFYALTAASLAESRASLLHAMLSFIPLVGATRSATH